jgi:hypothetical protein
MPPPYSIKTYERNVLNNLKKMIKEQERTNELLGEIADILTEGINRNKQNLAEGTLRTR